MAVALATLAGCAVSHDGSDGAVLDDAGIDSGTTCGAVRLCYPPGGCCGPRDGQVASCVDGAWTCPPGQSFECDPSCVADAGSDVSSCAAPADCVVVPMSCCGSCGAATPDDMIGVSRDAQDRYRSVACEGGMICPACAQEQDPALIATCAGGSCLAIDLHTSALTACTSDADCVLRPADCCGCDYSFIAIGSASEDEYRTLVCDPRADCPPCGPPSPPPGTSAVCDPVTHHCAVFAGG